MLLPPLVTIFPDVRLSQPFIGYTKGENKGNLAVLSGKSPGVNIQIRVLSPEFWQPQVAGKPFGMQGKLVWLLDGSWFETQGKGRQNLGYKLNAYFSDCHGMSGRGFLFNTQEYSG